MFLERLSRIASRIDGAEALALVSGDGILIESVTASEEIDLEVLAAELVAQVRGMASNHAEFGVGGVRRLRIRTGRHFLVLSELVDDHYLLLVVSESTSIGRALYELRRASLLFEKDLVA